MRGGGGGGFLHDWGGTREGILPDTFVAEAFIGVRGVLELKGRTSW